MSEMEFVKAEMGGYQTDPTEQTVLLNVFISGVLDLLKLSRKDAVALCDALNEMFQSDIKTQAAFIRKSTTAIINETEHWSSVVCSDVYWSPLNDEWVVLIDSSEDATLISKIVAGLLRLGYDVSVISG